MKTAELVTPSGFASLLGAPEWSVVKVSGLFVDNVLWHIIPVPLATEQIVAVKSYSNTLIVRDTGSEAGNIAKAREYLDARFIAGIKAMGYDRERFLFDIGVDSGGTKKLLHRDVFKAIDGAPAEMWARCDNPAALLDLAVYSGVSRWPIADMLARELVPMAFDRAGREDIARELRVLPVIVDDDTAELAELMLWTVSHATMDSRRDLLSRAGCAAYSGAEAIGSDLSNITNVIDWVLSSIPREEWRAYADWVRSRISWTEVESGLIHMSRTTPLRF